MSQDKIYSRMFVGIPVLLAIFGVVEELSYIHSGYLILVCILLLKYLYDSKEEPI